MPKKGYKQTEKHRKKISKAKIGDKYTQTTKDKMSKAKIGDKNPMFGKDRKGKKNGMFGKKQTQKAKNLMSKNHNHKPDCQCNFCKAKRGENTGENHPMYGKHYTQKTINRMCDAKSGVKNPMWRSSEYKGTNGYWIIWVNGIKYCRARYVAMKCLGRKLVDGELIHHLGVHYPMHSIENVGDDSPENLYVFSTKGEHTKWHRLKNPPILKSNLI